MQKREEKEVQCINFTETGGICREIKTFGGNSKGKHHFTKKKHFAPKRKIPNFI